VRTRQRIPDSIRILLATVVFTALVLWGVDYYRTRDVRRMRNRILEEFALPCDAHTTLFDGKPVADLIERARTGSVDERRMAVWGLGLVYKGQSHFGRSSMWGGPSYEERRMRLSLVEDGFVAPRAAVVLPALVGALEDPSPEVRRLAASQLVGIEAQALPACDALRGCLEDTDVETRLWAARALYLIRFETPGPIDASLEVLRADPEPRNRGMAAFNLCIMGRDAQFAVPALEAALKDPDSKVVRMVEQALTCIQYPRRY
jgi:hypothetical protein